MLTETLYAAGSLLADVRSEQWTDAALKFFPFALLLELPLYLAIVLAIVRFGLRAWRSYRHRERYPSVSCVITCYSEGDDVRKTIRTLAHQIYPGLIEVIAVIDGAVQNAATLHAARACAAEVNVLAQRRLIVLPKWERGGRVSGLNAGLQMAHGEIVMALDGDTSFDNDMVGRATRHFDDPNVVAVAGCLRVRNAQQGLAARMQAIEYMLSIAAGKTGLSELNIVNNVSGAFGIFRARFLRHIGGWDAGTAEDLDMTLRIKQYFGRHRNLRIAFEPHAVGHTDVPATWRLFFQQRLRWEGDLFYVFVRKYRFSIRPALLGWRNWLFVAVNGLMLQLIMPFVILFYSIALVWRLPLPVAAGIVAFVYLVALSLYFALYLLVVSERPRHDARFLPWLALYPLFAFATRLHSAAAIVQEVILKTHYDSAMAPWWVLRKTRF